MNRTLAVLGVIGALGFAACRGLSSEPQIHEESESVASTAVVLAVTGMT
ncbi:MAG: hypothetical protein ACE5GB_14935 [Acidimicrobiales bacterium]